MSTKEEREEQILHLSYDEQTKFYNKRDRNRTPIELKTPNPYSECPLSESLSVEDEYKGLFG